MPLVIRRAVLADAPAIVDFNRRLAEETEHRQLDRTVLTAGVERALVDPARALYFVCTDGTAVVGQMMVTYEWSDWRNGWIWWIQSVYVRADARRTGVFKGLFDHVLGAARAAGDVVALRLYVDSHNETAQRTYARLGLKPTEYLVLERCPLQGNEA